MPEKELTREEHKRVEDWIKGQGGGWRHGFDEGIIGSGVYKVGGEPLVVHGMLVHPSGGISVRYSLFCSEKHAAALEKAGVIRFSAEPQQGVETP